MDTDLTTIRYADENDVETLVSSALGMMLEIQGEKCSPETVEAGVRKILATPVVGFYLVAEWDGKPVGSLQVSSHWIDVTGGCLWWLQCAYIQPEHRRRGCFRRLREFALRLAEETPDVKGIRSLVSPENPRMIQINEALGWTRSPFITFRKNFT